MAGNLETAKDLGQGIYTQAEVDNKDTQVSDSVIQPKGFKNHIINGGFDVWQRGTSFSGQKYIADRWYKHGTGTSSVSKASSGTRGNYLHINYVTGDIFTLTQRIELNGDLGKFSGKTFTLSFDIFGSDLDNGAVPLSSTVYLNHTGGETTLVNTSYSSFQGKREWTFTLPDLSGYTIDSNSFLQVRPIANDPTRPTHSMGIYNIQLEEGSVATPFEQRPYGLELSLCHRYYYVSGDIQAGKHGASIGSGYSIYFSNSWTLPSEMRITPTILQNITVSTNSTGTQTGWATTKTYNFKHGNMSGDYSYWSGSFILDAEL